jgi:hypothetical protein
MYKLYENLDSEIIGVYRLFDSAAIPFAPDNTDYANFKAQIMADEAQLQDAEGVTMSPDAAKQFVATLP